MNIAPPPPNYRPSAVPVDCMLITFGCLIMFQKVNKLFIYFSELHKPHTKVDTSYKQTEYCSYPEIIHNMTLHGGLDAGLFTLHGDVDSFHECTKHCCNEKHCDLTMMVDDACYSVKCKDEKSCRLVKTSVSKSKVSIAFISREQRHSVIGIPHLSIHACHHYFITDLRSLFKIYARYWSKSITCVLAPCIWSFFVLCTFSSC